MIRAIAFDLDNVLVWMAESHYITLNQALMDVVGFEISYKEHMRYYNGLPTKIKLKMLNEFGYVDPSQNEQIYNLKQQYLIRLIDKFMKPDEVKIALHRKLQEQKYRICCVTNAIRETATKMLEKTGQLLAMEFIISNEDINHPKPSPDCYLLASEKLDIPTTDILVVEDTEKGQQAGYDAGCAVFKVKSPADVTWPAIQQIISIVDEIDRKCKDEQRQKDIKSGKYYYSNRRTE